MANPQLSKQLKRLTRKLLYKIPQAAQNAVAEAMEQGAEEIVALMKSWAPEQSGALKRSIGWTWGDAPKGSVVFAQSRNRIGKLRITIYAGNDEAFYARWVEFGTQTARSHPYFYPAWRSKKRRVKGRITRTLNKGLKRAAK